MQASAPLAIRTSLVVLRRTERPPVDGGQAGITVKSR